MNSLWRFLYLGALGFGTCELLWGLESWLGEGSASLVDFLILSALIVLVYRRSRSSPERLNFAVFIAAAIGAHLTLNVFAAKVTTSLIAGVNSSIYDSVSLAQRVVVCGFLTTWISYVVLSKRGRKTLDSRGFARLLWAEGNDIYRRACLVVVVVSLLIFLVLAILGHAPLLQENPLTARFDGLSDAPVMFALLGKLLIVVSLAAPMLLISQPINRKSLLLFMVALGAVALTANRERFFFLLFFAPACLLVLRKRSFLGLAWVAPVVFLAFFLTDTFLKFGNQLEARPAAEVAGSVMPEVRDLGWTLNLWDGVPLYGKSYAADILPLPTAILPFKREFVLGAITRHTVRGEDDDSNLSLRITGYGEAWLNFGLLGVVIFGTFLGWLVERGEVFLAIASTRSRVHFYGAAVIVLVPLLYLYLGGTAGIWDTTFTPAVVLLALFRSTKVSARTKRNNTLGLSTGVIGARA